MTIDTREEIQDYLDAAIRYWRILANSGIEHASYYVDAFQSARNTIFGSELPEDDQEKVKNA